MRHNQVLESLQKFKKTNITQTQIADALNYSVQKINKRAVRNSKYTEAEIQKIEKSFNVDFSNTNLNSDTISIDYYPDVIASCGSGGFEMSQECIKYDVPATLFPPSTDVKSYSMCHAKGNSMYPRIWDGDFVICEHKDNMKIENGEMYIFCFDDQIYLKRLTKNINQIVVESENPDFPTQYIEKDQMNDVHLIGHVICSGRMNGKYLDKRI